MRMFEVTDTHRGTISIMETYEEAATYCLREYLRRHTDSEVNLDTIDNLIDCGFIENEFYIKEVEVIGTSN